MPWRSFQLCLLMICSCLYGWGQQMPNYDKVDLFVTRLDTHISTLSGLDSLINMANQLFHLPEEKVRFVFSWVARNLEYECGDNGSTTTTGSSLGDILTNGRATCSGYSGMMNYALRKMGFESVSIRGVAKTARRDLYWQSLPRPNHAWNAVKVHNEWKLLDATWASGEASENCDTVIRNFSPFYFFADPTLLALTHFPTDRNWQLLREPVDSMKFLSLPVFHDPFYEKQVTGFYPESGLLRVKKGDFIRFRFRSRLSLSQIAIWSEDRKSVGAEFGKLVANRGEYEYQYRVRESGDYSLNVSLEGKRTDLVYRILSNQE